jgi:acyl dehydratase
MTDLLHAPLRNQLHGEQGFTHHRPITAGDVLTTTAMLTKVRSSGGRMIVGIDYEITDEAGGPVTTARSTIVVSGVGQ